MTQQAGQKEARAKEKTVDVQDKQDKLEPKKMIPKKSTRTTVSSPDILLPTAKNDVPVEAKLAVEKETSKKQAAIARPS